MIYSVSNNSQHQDRHQHQRQRRYCIVAFFALGVGVMSGSVGAEQAIAQSAPIFESTTVSPGFSPDPRTLRGISGGSVAAREIAGRAETTTGPCVGFVDRAPDHNLTLNSFFDFLSVEVQSPEDTTLVVKGPGGAWCNDDISGKNPGLAGQWQPGNYQLWVGSYQKDQYFPYVLRVTQIR
ncbi:MAG: hypothetical protein SW833_23335 [Cyanobacteriota bacterium]|nr:hypothetical protein [Cyanobacteriota bacterium]